jgi:hypothetical protein
MLLEHSDQVRCLFARFDEAHQSSIW